ncbi:hypothetical protein SEA_PAULODIABOLI_295 [Microbacterium phage PauloDiaboli]|nr:hypothetical protein SEA_PAULODIABOLI_295 [Microbacterium phage PauloDiaboli]QWY84102.1 hypothetical protein SEA_A3WALLY_295 [Microbacterium phage A3Wally]
MKIWLDDERGIPDDSWTMARSSRMAIELMRRWQDGYASHQGYVRLDEVSLDHDLGGDDNGFIVLDWMVEHEVWPRVLTIHTSNPPARKRMLATANAEAPGWVDIYVITDHLRKQ